MTTKPNDATAPDRTQEAIASRYAAGDSIGALAADYGLNRHSVKFAIRRTLGYLLDEQRAAGQRLGGRSAAEFVQERIAEKARIEAKPTDWERVQAGEPWNLPPVPRPVAEAKPDVENCGDCGHSLALHHEPHGCHHADPLDLAASCPCTALCDVALDHMHPSRDLTGATAPVAESLSPVAGEPDFYSAENGFEFMIDFIGTYGPKGGVDTRGARRFMGVIKSQLAASEQSLLAEREHSSMLHAELATEQSRLAAVERERDDYHCCYRDEFAERGRVLRQRDKLESALAEANARAERLVELVQSSAPLTWAASADTVAAHEWEKRAEWVLSGANAAETAQSPKQAGEPVAGELCEACDHPVHAERCEATVASDFVCGCPPSEP